MRMTGAERREQLLDIGRTLFADKGFEGTSVEEIAAKAGVSKPVVYEHFGGKEGLYAVVVDREMRQLLRRVTGVADRRAPQGTARTGGVRAARLHRAVHGRLPHPGAGFAGGPVDGHVPA
ncbi:transcriptional regulator [Streptomyces clavuligerus]|nr:transcriptional regulator [Streptomyces clavuligerus]